jgi:hypothetical protein
VAAVEELTCQALRDVLRERRESCNARFERLSAQYGPLDGAAFGELVRGPVQRITAAVEPTHRAEAPVVARHTFETALDLFARGFLGPNARVQLAAALWDRFFDTVPDALAESPRKVLAGITNAAISIAQGYPAAADRWYQRLLELAPLCRRAGELLECALVVSWTSGLAHYRESALARWQSLPEPLQRACLGIADHSLSTDALREALKDRWCDPLATGADPALCIAGVAGGFRGFGGPFVEPPAVVVYNDTIYAFDRESCCQICADCFGATVRRVPDVPSGASSSGAPRFQLSSNGVVKTSQLERHIPMLAGSLSSCATTDTLAATLPHSHNVYLVACARVQPAPTHTDEAGQR